jgi:hypothetical protein
MVFWLSTTGAPFLVVSFFFWLIDVLLVFRGDCYGLRH